MGENKSEQVRSNNTKITNYKKSSIAEEMEKLKQRRDDRKRKFEEDKKLKSDNQSDSNGKIDQDYENLIKLRKAVVKKRQIEPVSYY